MTPRAVLIDALGTMVELEPPWEHLAPALELEVNDALIKAVRKEMAFYKEHAHEGADEESLAALRARCAEILSWELDREVPVEVMMDSIRFRAYPDAEPALRELRDAGLRIVCVSNWDISLGEVLERCGLAPYMDGIVSSAAAGVRKPDPAIFVAALDPLGLGPVDAVHVGDTPEEDVEGARAAGIEAILLDRSGEGGDITSLSELPARVLA